MRASLLAISVALLLVSSCSIMGLDEIPPERCDDPSDCKYADTAFPDPNRCHSYECRGGLCVLPSMQEHCDYLDNDCDGWIDDGVDLVGSRQVAEPATIPSAFAAASNGTAAFVVIGGKTASGWRLGGDAGGERREPGTPLRYLSPSSVEAKPCISETGPIACDFSQVAMAADREHIVFATVSAAGCSDGLLRIGLSRIDREPFSIRLDKDPGARTLDESNIRFGVDVEGNCSGKSVGRPGVSFPAVAAQDGDPRATNALVAWLYSSLESNGDTEEGCARAEPSVVGALGVFVPEGEYDWVDGTNGGMPEHLGESSSLSPPAVLALSGASPEYLVAFASIQDGKDGLRFHLVRSDSTGLTARELHSHESAGADRVTLALGRERNEGVDVGVAWNTGCGADQVLHFALVDPGTGEIGLARHWELGVPMLIGAPRLLFEPEGFATEPRATGGWSLLWLEASSEGSELKMVRLSEDWLVEPMSEAAPALITLRPGGSGAPVVYPGSHSELRYALAQFDSAGRPHLETIGGWCDVRD